MTKMFLSILKISIFSVLLSVPVKAWAVCPACTLAVGAGVGLSRWLGIDDTISGVWIGALIASVTFWMISWFEKKNINFKFRGPITVVSMYLLTIVPLYYSGLLSEPFNVLWGVNKLLLGMIAGTALFLGAIAADRLLRNKNKGKVLFYYQKVILPVGFLLIGSILFYFIT
jgi:hypothetical protein